MKTSHAHNQQFSFTHNAQTDAQREADFDELMMRATLGDTRAIGAIAIACGPALLEEARAVMGDFAHDAEEVMQDFLLTLLDGRSRFTPAHGRAVAWMYGIVRAMARKYRNEREREWGITGDP